MNKTTVNGIEFTRINNDVNGNPRYVVHYTNLSIPSDANHPGHGYALAIMRAHTIGGKKYNNKQYGGGIVFQSYSLPELAESIKNALK
jgi:hypothetical protein